MDLSVAKSQRRSSVVRKRGRPAGNKRVSLTMEERRARNAEYERERREDIADALAELADAINVDPDITAGDLLAEVVNFFRTTEQIEKAWSADALRRCNDNLASQIKLMERDYTAASDARLQKKRELEEGDWLCPPSKRFSPDQECQDQFQSARTRPMPSYCRSARTEPIPNVSASVHKHWKKQHTAQFVQYSQPWPTSDSYSRQSQLGSFPAPQSSCRIQELQSSSLAQEPSNPQSSSSVAHLPVSCYPVSTPCGPSPPLIPASQVSCCYTANPNAPPKDLQEMTRIWRDHQYVASDPQISFDQIDFFATEEDLLLLYL